MKLKVKRLALGLGAEVSGVDISKPLDPETAKQVIDAWHAHGVLVFRGQELNHAQHIAFARNFGEVEAVPIKHMRNAEHPEIMTITSRPRNGKPSESGDYGRTWHTDGAYTLRPARGSLLRCAAIPEFGGNTWFASLYMAYDTLSEPMKRVVEGLKCVYQLRSFIMKGATDEAQTSSVQQLIERDRNHPAVVHSMVRIHPMTGRKVLYISEAHTVGIYGMHPAESRALLDYLFKHAVRPEFTYRHYWQKHDMVIWDNRCGLHLAPADYDRSQIREMHRVTLVGEAAGELYQKEELAA